jgi:hypothetical protein
MNAKLPVRQLLKYSIGVFGYLAVTVSGYGQDVAVVFYRSPAYLREPRLLSAAPTNLQTLNDPHFCKDPYPDDCLAVVPTQYVMDQTLRRISSVEAKQATLGTTVIQALDKYTKDLKRGTSNAALKQRIETLELEVADLQKQLATKQ